MMFADIRTEWRVDQIERDIRGKAEAHEVSTLSSDVVRLQRTNREISSCVDGLRSTVEACLERIERLEQEVMTLTEPVQ